MPHRYRLLNETQSSPPRETLLARQPMARDRASTVHATGDRVLRHGLRVLLQAGLHGAERFHILDTEPGQMTPSYPKPNVERVVARSPPLPLTPGHFVRFMVVALPSGMTEETGAVPTGAQGRVALTAVYSKVGSVTVTEVVSVDGSDEEFGAQPAGAGDAWESLQRVRSSFLLPSEDLSDPETLADWTEDVTVTLTLSYAGSPRAIDVVVYEEALALGYDLAAGGWLVPLHATKTGNDAGQLAGDVPFTRFSAGDPGGGAESIIAAAARLPQEIGPVLVAASCWSEANQDINSTEAVARSTTSTSFVELWRNEATAFTIADEGWSPASGAHARRVQDAEEVAVLRDLDNVAPVTCWIYARMTTAGPTATVRFESAAYSVAEVTVPSGTSWAWHSATGHLRCGLGAQDPAVLQVRARVTAGTFEWRYIFVSFNDV